MTEELPGSRRRPTETAQCRGRSPPARSRQADPNGVRPVTDSHDLAVARTISWISATLTTAGMPCRAGTKPRQPWVGLPLGHGCRGRNPAWRAEWALEAGPHPSELAADEGARRRVGKRQRGEPSHDPPQTPGHARPHAATIGAAGPHARPRPAPSSHPGDAPHKRGVAGSNPAAPTRRNS